MRPIRRHALRTALIVIVSSAALVALCTGGAAGAESEFLLKTQNLGDLTSITAALENLGLIRLANDTALGREALAADSTGKEDTAFGAKTLASNLSGSQDTVFGDEADPASTESSRDIAIGTYAMRDAEKASGNVAVGNNTLFFATTAKENVAVGNGALESHWKEPQTGERNTAVGREAGTSDSSGSKNTVIGFAAGSENRTGSGNTVVGTDAIGNESDTQPVSNSENTALGAFAGASDESGSGNVFIGFEAGAMVKNVSEVLYVDDGPTESPLIYGNFKTNALKVNGRLEATEAAATPVKPIEGESAASAPAIVARKTSFALTGNGAKTKWLLKDGLDTRLVNVSVQRLEGGQPGELEQAATYRAKPVSNNEIEVSLNVAPRAGEERFVTVTG